MYGTAETANDTTVNFPHVYWGATHFREEATTNNKKVHAVNTKLRVHSLYIYMFKMIIIITIIHIQYTLLIFMFSYTPLYVHPGRVPFVMYYL